MLTTLPTPEIIARSVWAVPPLALNFDYSVNFDAAGAMLRHIEAGGVSTILWGGNANLHNLPVSRFEETMGGLAALSGTDSWVLPSVGPAWGKLVDEAAILKRMKFPTAMVLPMQFPQTPEGVEVGIRDFVQRAGIPVVIYIKTADYLPPAVLARMGEAGELVAIKYAVPRPDYHVDPYLTEILKGFDHKRVVSGFGEPPALPHLEGFNLAGFTAGCVCIAPAISMNLLRLMQRRDFAGAAKAMAAVKPLEGLREQHNAIRTLHEAVTLSGIADMGPMLPLLSNLDKSLHPAIQAAARDLLAMEMAFRGAKAAE